MSCPSQVSAAGLHPEPSIHPADPVAAFVSTLLEEFGDEWGNKWMFHYRWAREVDQLSTAGRLARAMMPAADDDQHATMAAMVRERMVGRVWFLGSSEQNAPRTQSRTRAPSALTRIRGTARKQKDVRFTALLHHVTLERLEEAYRQLKPTASPGVDGVTWADYGKALDENLQALHERVHRGAYRAKPSRRAYIPKADGTKRPLGITEKGYLKDKEDHDLE